MGEQANLSAREISFLRVLLKHGGFATADQIPGSNRDEDKARQRCRRRGLAEWVKGPTGVKGWRLTDAGRAVGETK